MKDVLVGRKNVRNSNSQLIRMKDLKSINTPRPEDYRIEDEYEKAIAWLPELKTYFPHYDGFKYTPPRLYFWEVYHTLDPKHVD